MPKLSRVLLVDDDPTNNFLNHRLLHRLDLVEHIDIALNGQEALAWLQAAGPNQPHPLPELILLDVQMPILSGIEFLEIYQHLPGALRRAITIVVLTTSLDVRDLARLAGLPAHGQISKPLTPEKFDYVLQLHAARLASQADQATAPPVAAHS